MAGLQGRVFGGYRLAEQMAGGGIAEVYRAQAATSGGREVVVKIIYPEFARQPGFQSNFRNIVQMAAKLTSHPHILPVIANGEEGGYLYLVTPYVAGGTLRDWLQAGHRLGPTDVGPFFRQLCGALAFAHSLGIVHSNLKLSNVFLFEGRHVLVADFGLLWDISHLDMNHTGSGTDAVEFLAPEGFSGQFTQQSDIYALGALLFATLTGFPPFQGRKPADLYSAHMQHPVPRLAQAAPQVSASLQGLDSVIQRAMAKRPEDRFPSAMALTQAIEGALRQPMPAQMGGAPLAIGAPAAAPVYYPAAQPAIAPPAQPYAAPPGRPQPGLGAMAAAAPLAPGAPLSRLDPPFPPLGGEQRVDANMDQGHGWPTLAHAAIPRQQPNGAAPSNDSEVLRTAVVAKPVINPGQGRAPMQPPGAGNGSPSRAGDFEDLGPSKLPAIRPPGRAGSANNGSAQAGAFPAFPVDSPLGDDRFDGGTDYHRSLAANGSSQGNWWDNLEAEQGGSQALVPWPGTDYRYGDASMSHSGAFAKPAFSATELDLPRLTNPALEGELPPEWEDLLADEFASQRAANGRNGHNGHSRNSSYEPDYGNSQLQPGGYPSNDYSASSSYNGWSNDMSSNGWSNNRWSSQMESNEWAGAGVGVAQQPRYSEPSPPQGNAQPPQWEHPSRRGAGGYPGDSFLDQPVWTVGRTAVRRQHHWVRWLMLALVLFTVGAATVLVVKPSLCPIPACAQANQFVRSHLPILSAAPQQNLLFVPTSLDLKTITEGATTGSLAMSNPGAEAVTWKASTDLLWLTVLPSAGTLPASGTIILAVAAKPVGINPDAYHSTVQVQVGNRATSIPVTIEVAPGPQLSFSPKNLTFTTCDAPQKLTVKNSGGGPLSFTATSSKSDSMTLSATKGTLDPGKSVSITVSMTCSAIAQNYVVILISNGGSANVPIQYS